MATKFGVQEMHISCLYLLSRHLDIVIIVAKSKREATFFFLFILGFLELLPLPLGTLTQTFELLQAFLEQLWVFPAESLDKQLVWILDVVSESRDALFLIPKEVQDSTNPSARNKVLSNGDARLQI